MKLDKPQMRPKVPKKEETRNWSIAQNYLALIIVAAVFLGLAFMVRLDKTEVTLEWPVLVVLTVALGVWVLDVLRRAIFEGSRNG